MTVEATLVVPMIFVGIIFTIYLGLYLYNASTIKQAAYIAALRGSQLTGVSSETIENYVEQQLEELLDNQILARGNVQMEVKVSSQKVRVRIMTDMSMPFTQFLSSAINLWTIESETEAVRINPVDIIRNVRKADGSQISK